MRTTLWLPVLCNVFLLVNVCAQNKAGFPLVDSVPAGSALLPAPQKVSLSGQHYILDDSWAITAVIPKTNPAIASLTSELKERFGVTLKSPGRSSIHSIEFVIKPGSVIIGPTTDTNRTLLKQQAYRLQLQQGRIVITANGSQGLFYGVQTLLQLLHPHNDNIYFSAGEIVDWPNMDLRMIYWDDAHHLERLGAMKRAIRQASYYKINAFSVKLEGHFQFKSAKPVVEPYAYTPAELQELTDYAKAHYVELVPFLDAPAHISFILKHPEYTSLRAFPNSNYEASVINPEADKLLLGMFDDLMDANKGGKYILLSTDEAYYVGKSPEEKKRAEALGGNGKLLAEYITRIGNKLHEKGRKVIIWAEYPLTLPDINALPSHIINGVYNDKWAPSFKEHGMRQLIYTSVQGVEPHFPNYYKVARKIPAGGNNPVVLNDDEEQQGDLSAGRIAEVLKEITSAAAAGKADLMGVIVAAWGDAGLNPETFWLGYAAGAAGGWNHASMTSQELTSRFYSSFFGNKTVQVDRMYQLLSTQADFWDKSWNWVASNWRTPIFGNSYGVFDTARKAKDQALPLLPVPSGTSLSLSYDWNNQNKERLEAAKHFLLENNELMNLLHQNLVRIDKQHYHLQVLHSIALLCRQNLNMLLDLERINNFLLLSSKAAAANPALSISLLDEALTLAQQILDERNDMLQSVTTTWYQDWNPRVAEANGRKFLHQVDDVKDHQPVRTVDMSYLIYRQLKYPLGKWVEEVVTVRNQLAKKHNQPQRAISLDWEKY